MWKMALPDVPKYFWKGKGLGMDPNELFMAATSANGGFEAAWAGAAVAGDYHNGPLSVIIPFGIFGTLAFAWLLVAGMRYLHRQYQTGDPELRGINRFLLASFTAHAVYFLFVFGGFRSDLFLFTGILGLSVSLNGRSPEAATVQAPVVALKTRATSV
jgi:hypothetical protein